MSGPLPAKGHMPFEGHRNCAEWAEDERDVRLRRALELVQGRAR